MLRAPGQNLRRPINRVVAEPGLGRRDLPSWYERALFAGEYADDGVGTIFPRKPQTAGRVLLVREIEKRRQRRDRADLPFDDELRNVEDVDRRRVAGYRLLRVDVCDG